MASALKCSDSQRPAASPSRTYRRAALAVVASVRERRVDRYRAAAMQAAHFDEQRCLRAVEVLDVLARPTVITRRRLDRHFAHHPVQPPDIDEVADDLVQHEIARLAQLDDR